MGVNKKILAATKTGAMVVDSRAGKFGFFVHVHARRDGHPEDTLPSMRKVVAAQIGQNRVSLAQTAGNRWCEKNGTLFQAATER